MIDHLCSQKSTAPPKNKISMDLLTITITILVSHPFLFTLALLLKLYTRKSLRDPTRPPAKGTVVHQIFYFTTLYDEQTKQAKEHPTFRLLAPDHSEYYTVDPRNIEHVLKTRFDSYVKGGYQTDILRDLFGHGIFAVDGERWRHQRKLASFEFSTRVLRDFSCGVFRRSAVKLVRILSEFVEGGEAFDVHDILMRYALDSIFKVGFGVDLNCLDGSNRQGTKFMKAFDEANALVYWRYVDPLWKIKRTLNLGSEATLKRHIKTIDEFIHQVIKSKRESLQQSPDSMEKEDILSRFLIESKRALDVNDEYLRDIVLNFMIAGKDSTANTLAWFIYALSKNPLVQDKIVHELTQVFPRMETRIEIGNFVELLTDELLEKMNYLHAALTETLRLYPAVPVDGRTALSDDILPDGHRLNKGDDVYYIAYAMARMPFLWGEDAEEFRPERWIENGAFKPESPFKFITFNAGPRICLGKDFAYRQMKIVSLALIWYFRFRLVDEGKAVKYKTMFTLHIDGGLHVYASPRNQ